MSAALAGLLLAVAIATAPRRRPIWRYSKTRALQVPRRMLLDPARGRFC
jgi:hypothetical protein